MDTPVERVTIDRCGRSYPEFVALKGFVHKLDTSPVHCHPRFYDMIGKYHRKASGGVGCFTANSFMVFDHLF